MRSTCRVGVNPINPIHERSEPWSSALRVEPTSGNRSGAALQGQASLLPRLHVPHLRSRIFASCSSQSQLQVLPSVGAMPTILSTRSDVPSVLRSVAAQPERCPFPGRCLHRGPRSTTMARYYSDGHRPHGELLATFVDRSLTLLSLVGSLRSWTHLRFYRAGYLSITDGSEFGLLPKRPYSDPVITAPDSPPANIRNPHPR